MEKYYVVYDRNTAFWCGQYEAFELMVMGWRLYAVADDEETAEKLAEEACYF